MLHKEKERGEIRLSKWKVWTQGITPPFSPGYSLAVMLRINMNSSPPATREGSRPVQAPW